MNTNIWGQPWLILLRIYTLSTIDSSQHKLTLMHMEETRSGHFRPLLREIALLMEYEVTKDFPTKTVTIQTPWLFTTGRVFDGHDVTIVPILELAWAWLMP